MQYLAGVALEDVNDLFCTVGFTGAIGFRKQLARDCKAAGPKAAKKAQKEVRMPELTWSHYFEQDKDDPFNCLLVCFNMIEDRWLFKANSQLKKWANKMVSNQQGIPEDSINVRMNYLYPVYVTQVGDKHLWTSMQLTQVLAVKDI